jgi:hypothetical protein
MDDPCVNSWIEQINPRTTLRVDAGKVARLVKVTLCATPAKIIKLVASAVNAGNDMIDVERPFVGIIGQATIFAALARTHSHTLSRGRIHHLACRRSQHAPSFGLQEGNQRSGVSQRTIFVPLGFGDRSRVRFLSEFCNVRNDVGIRPKVKNPLRHRWCQRIRYRVEITIQKVFSNCHNA